MSRGQRKHLFLVLMCSVGWTTQRLLGYKKGSGYTMTVYKRHGLLWCPGTRRVLSTNIHTNVQVRWQTKSFRNSRRHDWEENRKTKGGCPQGRRVNVRDAGTCFGLMRMPCVGTGGAGRGLVVTTLSLRFWRNSLYQHSPSFTRKGHGSGWVVTSWP